MDGDEYKPPKSLQPGSQVLYRLKDPGPTGPHFRGWRRDGVWAVALIAWDNGDTIRVIERGGTRI